MKDLEQQLVALRPRLVRIARRRLHNAAWAEDAVSETLLAALERPGGWSGRAELLGWLTGILKHKLVDQVRRHARECAFDNHDDNDDGDRPPAPIATVAATAEDPLAWLERRQFIAALERSVQALPPRQGRAFVLCAGLEGGDTAAACRELGVTANHLAVMLHRARARLREALAPQWRPHALT